MKNRNPLLVLFVLMSTTVAIAQLPDCANSQKLVCQIPFSTGALYSNGIKGGSFLAAQTLAIGFNSAIASQISQLPLTSSSAGTVVLYTNGVPQTYNNLGPILTDRASTIGKHKFYLSFTASQFYFTDINGINLNKVPFSYQSGTTSVGTNAIIDESLNIHFKINQYVAIATYGVTNKLDVSMILPIERVSIGAATYATSGYITFSNGTALPYTVQPTNSTGIASGIGDIVFAAKYLVLSGERNALSVGLNERVPTGDDLNYLGSGAWGTNPYAVFSHAARLSPHVRLGYQWNSETELYPNPAGRPGNLALPGGLQYDFGADWAVSSSGWAKHVTLAADLMGNQYQNAPRFYPTSTNLTYTTTTAPPQTATVPLRTLTPVVTSTYWINDVSAGAKWNPWKELIISGNVLFQLNDVGMRARPTPLVGISYQFR